MSRADDKQAEKIVADLFNPGFIDEGRFSLRT